MSKEKQIEEMSALIYQNRPIKDIWNEDADSIAQTLYNSGYRKQSKGANISGAPSLFECSVCHWHDDDTYSGDTSEYNYCPNCGAKMKGGAE